MSFEPIKKGDVIRADWLNRVAREAGVDSSTGWGAGLISSGRSVARQPDYLTAMFKAQEDFEEKEDIYSGDAKLWWRNPENEIYEEHGDAIEVFSHEEGVEEGDIFAAFFNQQSGRWERIGGGGSGGGGGTPPSSYQECECGECNSSGPIDECTAPGWEEAPTTFTFDLIYPNWYAHFGTRVELVHIEDCIWRSDQFTDVNLGDDEAEDYYFELEASGVGVEQVSLKLIKGTLPT